MTMAQVQIAKAVYFNVLHAHPLLPVPHAKEIVKDPHVFVHRRIMRMAYQHSVQFVHLDVLHVLHRQTAQVA